MHTATAAALSTETAPAAYNALGTPPPLGQYWPGQGGRYLGLVAAEGDLPAAHLILAEQVSPKAMAWRKLLDWGKTVSVDGRADFHVPSRTESALVYANGRDLVDASKWYWTSTQFSADDAFGQYFSSGSQDSNDKKYEGWGRAVRRLPLQSFDPSESAEGQALLKVAEHLAFLVNSARLILTDKVAIGIAADAVKNADAVLALFRSSRSTR